MYQFVFFRRFENRDTGDNRGADFQNFLQPQNFADPRKTVIPVYKELTITSSVPILYHTRFHNYWTKIILCMYLNQIKHKKTHSKYHTIKVNEFFSFFPFCHSRMLADLRIQARKSLLGSMYKVFSSSSSFASSLYLPIPMHWHNILKTFRLFFSLSEHTFPHEERYVNTHNETTLRA